MQRNNSKIVIFTDLDGTLLDENYSFKTLRPILDFLIKSKVSIVLCSSKTRTEIEYYIKKIGLDEPFSAENGAAIYIPKGYFDNISNITEQNEKYNIIEFGIPYQEIRKKLDSIRKKCDCTIMGFGDMTIQDVVADCGLNPVMAKLAKQREYTEPFKVNRENQNQVIDLIKHEGLNFTKGGRYLHLMGYHDKGRATVLLTELFEEKFGIVKTFAVGDGENDKPMLNVVDYPFFIDNPKNMKLIWNKIQDKISKMIE